MGTHRLASRDREDGEAPGPTLSGGWLPRPGPEPGQVSPGVPGVLPVLQVLPVPSVLHAPLPWWIWIQLFSLPLLPSPCSDLLLPSGSSSACVLRSCSCCSSSSIHSRNCR